MHHSPNFTARRGLVLAFALLICTSVGCGALPHLVYWVRGVPVEAKYDGLNEKRVAVVCVANEHSFGDSGVSEKLARMVATHLRNEIEDIDVVHENEVAQWIDNTGWDQISYPEVGKGVKAEMVVAIDLASFSTDAGSHLFQGKSNYTVKVFDMEKGGQLVYRREESDFVFPKGGHPASGQNSSTFRKLFLQVVSRDIAKDFFDYQMTDDFAEDAAYFSE